MLNELLLVHPHIEQAVQNLYKVNTHVLLLLMAYTGCGIFTWEVCLKSGINDYIDNVCE